MSDDHDFSAAFEEVGFIVVPENAPEKAFTFEYDLHVRDGRVRNYTGSESRRDAVALLEGRLISSSGHLITNLTISHTQPAPETITHRIFRDRKTGETVSRGESRPTQADLNRQAQERVIRLYRTKINAQWIAAADNYLEISKAPPVSQLLKSMGPNAVQRNATTPSSPQNVDQSENDRISGKRSGEPQAGQNWKSPTTDMEFVWIPQMNIWVGKFEVTNEEYRKKEPHHNSGEFYGRSFNGNRQPVVMVNFDDAKAYAEWLTERDRSLLGGMRYRLPSEQEWQTYAQVGDGREYPWGNDWPPPRNIGLNYHGQEGAGNWGKIAYYRDDFPVTAIVDRLWRNPWHLFGVGGNVWEVCASDNTGNSFGAWRGASWRNNLQATLRCSYRIAYGKSTRNDCYGFRLILSR